MATKIVNIKEYSDTLTNFTMIDSLTPDIVKRKYIWLLNAIVKNAIIGQDDYGLVWYSGEWIAGEWEDGTWYSGIWHDGEWKNGNFYSYRFDTKQLLLRNKRILEKDNPIYSQFRNGIWRRGNFYNGYFGPVKYDNYSESGEETKEKEHWDNVSYNDAIYWHIRWESGDFYNGIFRNAAWMQPEKGTLKSNFHNGIFYNSEWINGTFLNGTFQGKTWWDGNFTGGDFVGQPAGTDPNDPDYSNTITNWWNGSFNQGNPNIKSRFGSYPITGNTMELSGTSVIWHNGTFINGEFHSGLNIISGQTLISNNHNRTVWLNGNWLNGLWYGGTHVDGNFNNGYWYEGFWSGGSFNNGYWINGYWLDGTINDGFISQGIFKNVIIKGGQIGYEPPEEIKRKLELTKLSIPPKIFTLSYKYFT